MTYKRGKLSSSKVIIVEETSQKRPVNKVNESSQSINIARKNTKMNLGSKADQTEDEASCLNINSKHKLVQKVPHKK